jgi:ATP-dependent RNA helicase MSS116
MVGGTDIKKDVREVKRGIDLLIVTPGRLQDHLKNTPGFKEKLKFARVLVLDEADQMLEMGFRKPIEQIITYLPKER